MRYDVGRGSPGGQPALGIPQIRAEVPSGNSNIRVNVCQSPGFVQGWLVQLDVHRLKCYVVHHSGFIGVPIPDGSPLAVGCSVERKPDINRCFGAGEAVNQPEPLLAFRYFQTPGRRRVGVRVGAAQDPAPLGCIEPAQQVVAVIGLVVPVGPRGDSRHRMVLFEARHRAAAAGLAKQQIQGGIGIFAMPVSGVGVQVVSGENAQNEESAQKRGGRNQHQPGGQTGPDRFAKY